MELRKDKIQSSDSPVESEEKDCFNLKKYIEGLSEYILCCETPTTIAIQGDWGSGKTSMLNMVKGHLGDDVIPIWFNTWQYSKFNMDDTLAISLLTHLCLALSKEADNIGIKQNDAVKKKLFALAKFAIRVGSYAVDMAGIGKMADDMNDLSKREETEDIVSAIEGLKEEFQNTIDKIYEKKGKRVVVFIDDLDRLAPAKAVDLMEVLKLFLDCNHCIYVLAIDYGVVTRGISEKYGSDFGQKQGKKFFDKIIQVPFFVPIEQYQIEKYLKQAMENHVNLEGDNIKPYISLIKKSVTFNPRSMRRLFNAYLLISTIYKEEGFKEDIDAQKILFATLCMQLSIEEIYKYVAERADELDDAFFDRFHEEAHSDNVEYYFEDIRLTEEIDLEMVISLMAEVANVLSDKTGSVSQEKVDKLTQVLKVSSSTNVVQVNKVRGAKVLEENIVIEKIIGTTDVKYKIMCAGAGLHIGFGEKVTFSYAGKDYSVKMHSKAKGRIDGLGAFYKDTNLKVDDIVVLTYIVDEKRVECRLKD